jgi:hypothetical protein
MCPRAQVVCGRGRDAKYYDEVMKWGAMQVCRVGAQYCRHLPNRVTCGEEAGVPNLDVFSGSSRAKRRLYALK